MHQDEDVFFWWSKLCDVANVESECSKALVHYVVDHYVQGLQRGCRYLRKAAYRIFVVQRAVIIYISLHANISLLQ